MMDNKTFRLRVIASDGLRADETVSSVILPAYDGKYGILRGHAPLILLLTAGDVSFTREDGSRDSVRVTGGVADIDGNVDVIIG